MTRRRFDAGHPIGPDQPEPTGGSRSGEGRSGGSGGIPDELIDSILDGGGMARDSMREALDTLHLDQNNLDNDFWTADALHALRADVMAPDLSEIILARTGMHRSWLSNVMRRKLVIGRIAGVAAMLALIGGAFMIQRAAPEAFNDTPTPVRELANAFPNDAAHAASVMARPVAYRALPAPTPADTDIFMPDTQRQAAASTWRDSLLAMESLRDLWAGNRPAADPVPIYAPTTATGMTSDTITLIAPILPDKERESSAAIIAGQR